MAETGAGSTSCFNVPLAVNIVREMIFVNFKTYQKGTGEAAFNLAKICQEVAKETDVTIVPVVQTADIFRLARAGLTVWAQHLDDIDFGPNTGQVLSWVVVEAGAKGTILNHSENKLPIETIGSTIKKVQGSRFKVLVCAESVEEGKQIAQFKPDFLAYEPPELIGGDVSVSKAKPEIIRDFVGEIRNIPVLVGAGIHTPEDVRKAISLGAVGILVSSSVVLAKNPKEILVNLAGGFKKK